MKSQHEFKVGEVVLLNSGGPTMTVIKVSGQNLTCRWFEKERDRQNSFPATALKLDGVSVQGPGIEELNNFFAGRLDVLPNA